MRTAIGITLLVLAMAGAVVPAGHCVPLLLDSGDDCCCELDTSHTNQPDGEGCGCLFHPTGCCYVLSSSIFNQDGNGADTLIVPSSVLPALTTHTIASVFPTISTDDIRPPGGPPLFIRHATILI